MSCVVENFAVRPNQSHLRLFESIPLRKVCVCSCYYSTVSVSLSCIVSEIKRHVGQKSRFSYSYNNTLCVYGYKHSLASLTPLNVLPREATHKRGLYRRAVSVCLSVRYVRDCVETNKHIFIKFSPSRSHTVLVFLYQTSCQYSDGDPLTGASNVCGVGKNGDSQRISGYRIDDWWSANNNCERPPCSLPQRRRRISESLFITNSMDYHDEENRAEFNCTQR